MEKGQDAFSGICAEIFDKHAPKKKRYIRYNYKPFIDNEIFKAIMTTNRLRNCILKNRSVKIENYFANKEISAFHFCENLKRIISQV